MIRAIIIRGKKRGRLGLLLGLTLSGLFFYPLSELRAQQEPLYTQYVFNGLAINPAYAGSFDNVSLTALGRWQWRGIEGAPETQTFSIHAPIKQSRSTVGALVMHDNLGVQDSYLINGIYAYRLPLTEKSSLAFGLQLGFAAYRANFSEISTLNAPDSKRNIPSIGAGAFYFTDKFYAGISIPQLLESELYEDDIDTGALDGKIRRHYFVTAGYVVDLNPNIKFKPSVLLKVVAGSPMQLDLNASFLIKEVLWVGVAYRSLATFAGQVQLKLNAKITAGYAYDFFHTTELRKVQRGSHEIGLNYRFSLNSKQVIHPRYF